MKIISTGSWCDAEALHVRENDNIGTQQCINCGYSSADKFKCKSMKKNKHWKTLPKDMKDWTEYKDGWITARGTFQKGYTGDELIADLQTIPLFKEYNIPFVLLRLTV